MAKLGVSEGLCIAYAQVDHVLAHDSRRRPARQLR